LFSPPRSIEQEEVVNFFVSLLDMICSAAEALMNQLIELYQDQTKDWWCKNILKELERYFGAPSHLS
jgi:hypothetical protein